MSGGNSLLKKLMIRLLRSPQILGSASLTRLSGVALCCQTSWSVGQPLRRFAPPPPPGETLALGATPQTSCLCLPKYNCGRTPSGADVPLSTACPALMSGGNFISALRQGARHDAGTVISSFGSTRRTAAAGSSPRISTRRGSQSIPR